MTATLNTAPKSSAVNLAELAKAAIASGKAKVTKVPTASASTVAAVAPKPADQTATPTIAAAPKVRPDKGSGTARMAAKWPREHLITVLIKGGKRVAGKPTAARFAEYRDGMTVGEYLDILETKYASQVTYKVGYPDIRWDVVKGNIRIDAPAPKAD